MSNVAANSMTARQLVALAGMLPTFKASEATNGCPNELVTAILGHITEGFYDTAINETNDA